MSGYAWYDLGNGRKVYAKARADTREARSEFPSPRLLLDTMEETKSMADGKIYTSKAAIRSSYRAENNPLGINFTEVGNEDTTKVPEVKRDQGEVMAAIERAASDLNISL